jgi:hypothetical protein
VQPLLHQHTTQTTLTIHRNWARKLSGSRPWRT